MLVDYDSSSWNYSFLFQFYYNNILWTKYVHYNFIIPVVIIMPQNTWACSIINNADPAYLLIYI